MEPSTTETCTGCHGDMPHSCHQVPGGVFPFADFQAQSHCPVLPKETNTAGNLQGTECRNGTICLFPPPNCDWVENLHHFTWSITNKKWKVYKHWFRANNIAKLHHHPVSQLSGWSFIRWVGRPAVMLVLLMVKLRGSLNGLGTHTMKGWVPVCTYLSGTLRSSAASGATGRWAGPHASTSGTLCAIPPATWTAGSPSTARRC